MKEEASPGKNVSPGQGEVRMTPLNVQGVVEAVIYLVQVEGRLVVWSRDWFAQFALDVFLEEVVVAVGPWEGVEGCCVRVAEVVWRAVQGFH